MKEATSELSVTAIAVVAIAAISVVFSTLVWPQIKSNIERSTKCSGAYNCKCDADDGAVNGLCKCIYYDEEKTDTVTIMCKNPEGAKTTTAN